MLVLNNIIKSYAAVHNGEPINVLHLPYLSIEAGEKAALIGPSGSGKSTLLNMIAGMIRPTSGTITLLETDLAKLSEQQMDRFRAKHIGYIFQSFHLLPGYTALENVLIAMRFANSSINHQHHSRARELLARVGLEHRSHHKSSQLSSGEQQRVAIARALANQPSILLADEPTASLDTINREKILSLLIEICSDLQTALLLCTHDLSLVKYTDRTIRLHEGSSMLEKEALAHVSS